jgi:CheY-like chemotaxis protein
VTQRYRDAEALRAAKEQAEHANEAKDRFLAVLSHELRTPLTPIVAAAHLLERTAIVPPRQQHLLPMIRRNVALEARLIDDLLDLTAIASGKVHLKRGPVDVHGVIARVVDMLHDPLHEAKLTLGLELEASESIVDADEARLQQVVWNVVRNAIKFTPAGGMITLATRSSAGRIEVRCTDTGMGIPQEALSRIFAPFEQADREVAQRLGGLGLGLAIAKGLAEQHEGTLTVESDGPGRGATFTLSLRQMQPAAGSERAPAEDAAAPVQGMRLLLVEDNLDAAATMTELLQLYGWEVTHAATCAAALDAARTQVFHAVLTDLGLPDGSGIDVGKELSQSLPVVALSGYGASPDLQRSAMAGFAGHLVKPADPERVHQTLQRGVEDYRMQQRARQRA